MSPLVEDVRLPPDAQPLLRVPRKKRRKKPYKYRSVTLGRKPTPLEERLISLTEIPSRLDALTTRLTETLSFLRRDQVSQAISTTTMRSIATETREALWAVAVDAAQYGAFEHHQEWRRQGLDADPDPTVIQQRLDLDVGFRRRLHQQGDWVLHLWLNHVSVTEERLRRALSDLRPDEWRAFVERDIQLHLKSLSTSVVNTGFAKGRQIERDRILALAKNDDDVFEGERLLVFSAVLDSNCCDECSDADGTIVIEGSDEQDILDPPYYKCLSVLSGTGNKCRCQWITAGPAELVDHLEAIIALRTDASTFVSE